MAYGSHLAKSLIMPLADISKWTGGETEAFFDPLQTPPAASVDGNPREERLTGRVSLRKFAHLTIAAVIGGFASAASVCFVVLMRDPVEPSRAADAKLPSSASVTLVTGGRVPGDIEGSRPITASPAEIISTLAVPILSQPTAAFPDARVEAARPERKPAAASRRDRPRYSAGDQADREETARLMRDELRQRGVAAGAAAAGPSPGGGFYGAPKRY
jgi:hypothetical protein